MGLPDRSEPCAQAQGLFAHKRVACARRGSMTGPPYCLGRPFSIGATPRRPQSLDVRTKARGRR